MANGFQVSQFPRAGGLNIGGAIQQGLQIRGQRQQQEQREQQAALTTQSQELPLLVEGARRISVLQSPESKLQLLQTMRTNFGRAGLSTAILDQGIQQLRTGDTEGFDAATSQLLEIGEKIRTGGASARAFAPETIRKVVGKDEEGNDVTGLFSRQVVFDPATQTSKAIETPIEGELVTSTGETITQQRLAEVETKRAEAEAKAEGKATGEARAAPLVAKAKAQIKTAVKLAEKAATARGETITELARAEAALPGLRETIGQLKELAPIATSTLGARIFDTAVKETGFGSTKGANARVKFTAIINNQVLPLLRSTFGAAFTEREGETLKATMGDPNATPEQKITQLNAFIDNKVREIQGKQREVGADVTLTEELRTGAPVFSGALNREITEADITDTLTANPGLTREALLQQLQVQ